MSRAEWHVANMSIYFCSGFMACEIASIGLDFRRSIWFGAFRYRAFQKSFDS